MTTTRSGLTWQHRPYLHQLGLESAMSWTNAMICSKRCEWWFFSWKPLWNHETSLFFADWLDFCWIHVHRFRLIFENFSHKNPLSITGLRFGNGRFSCKISKNLETSSSSPKKNQTKIPPKKTCSILHIKEGAKLLLAIHLSMNNHKNLRSKCWNSTPWKENERFNMNENGKSPCDPCVSNISKAFTCLTSYNDSIPRNPSPS